MASLPLGGVTRTQCPKLYPIHTESLARKFSSLIPDDFGLWVRELLAGTLLPLVHFRVTGLGALVLLSYYNGGNVKPVSDGLNSIQAQVRP